MKTAILERNFSAAARKSAAASGAAMPDGSYPIKNESDLKNAIQAIGRAKNPAATKAHIRKRAKALGMMDSVPANWKESYDLSQFGTSLIYEADGVTQQAGSFDAIRSRIQSALNTARNAGEDLDLDGDNDAGYDGSSCWVMDVFPSTVVYSMDGDLFQCDYSDDGEMVALGKPVEVERSYSVVPSDGQESSVEVSRALAVEVESLKESAYDSSKGVLTVTVIKPGFSKNKTKIKESGKVLPRYYLPETLKRDHKVFNNSKMFADHQTEAEAKVRPEGSVKDWVASLGETWTESDGTVMGTATVIDPQFKAKLDLLNKNGMLKEMKTSVRIAAGVTEGTAEGKDAAIIESIFSNKSVDFVNYAGAGGQVEAMESAAAEDVDVMSLQELSERRPDLIELIESRVREENTMAKSLEQQLQESTAKITTLEAEKKVLEAKVTEAEKDNAPAGMVAARKHNLVIKENDELKKENQELKEGQQKRDAAAKLELMLKESKLPDVLQTRLRKQFKDALSDEDFEEAINEEKQILRSIGGKTEVKNLGESSSLNHKKGDLVGSFSRMGLTEAEAKIAAALR